MAYVFYNHAKEPVYVVVVGSHGQPDFDFAHTILDKTPDAVDFSVTEFWDIEDYIRRSAGG